MTSAEKLKELFMQLPGIGPRQAGRFLHFFLTRGPVWRSAFAEALSGLDAEISQCSTCKRFFDSTTNTHSEKCRICLDTKRNSKQLLVVLQDVDIKQIEKGGEYDGLYFVLGSLITLAGNSNKRYARTKELYDLISTMINDKLGEVILALPATPDGEYTTDIIKSELSKSFSNIKVTVLGRGLSVGSEIEYADPNTINSAIKNRA